MFKVSAPSGRLSVCLFVGVGRESQIGKRPVWAMLNSESGRPPKKQTQLADAVAEIREGVSWRERGREGVSWRESERDTGREGERGRASEDQLRSALYAFQRIVQDFHC